MTLHVRAKMLCIVWSYNFYDMTLSTSYDKCVYWNKFITPELKILLQKPTSELMAAIQLGIGQSVGGLSSKPERDLLMQDFGVIQQIFFPRCVSKFCNEELRFLLFSICVWPVLFGQVPVLVVC